MDAQYIIFWFFALLMLYGGVRVITIRNPVHAALHLVLTFFASAGLWILLGAEFLAITLVLVYVGAVMVLFLFIVMMLDVGLSKITEGFVSYWPIVVLVGIGLFLQIYIVVDDPFFSPERYSAPATLPPANYSNTAAIGKQLYTDYFYPFEVAAVVLLLAIVAAIALTLRHRPEVKKQLPNRQVKVKAKERLRIVNVDVDTPVNPDQPRDSSS